MTPWWLVLAFGGVGEEVPPLGEAATMADGAGVILSVGAGSPDLLADLPDIPVVPRVGIAAFLEPADAVLVGLRIGGAGILGTDTVAPAGEAAVAVALGSRERTVWTGGEIGVGITPGEVETPDAALLAAATFGVDVDPISSIGFRLGMAAGANGLEQRHGLVASFRPAPRTGISAGVHGGVAQGTHSLAAQLTFHQRLGPLTDAWTEPVVVVESVIDVDIQEHPELQCEEGDVPTGRPPPLGLEGWCARVAPNGTTTRHGPYVRWHDMVTVAERGQYTDGLRSGTWEAYDHEGNLRERGDFVAGKEDGAWTNTFADGSIFEEGDMRAGERDGRWRFYDREGRLDVEGSYADGRRVGPWYDYGDDGTRVRERRYEDGRMMQDQRLVVEETEAGEGAEVRDADGTVPTSTGPDAPNAPPPPPE